MATVHEGLQDEIQDFEALVKVAKTTRAKQLLQAELSTLKSLLQQEMDKAAAMQVDNSATTMPVSSSVTPSVPEAKPVLMATTTTSGPKKLAYDITKYGWDQSTTAVKVYATIPMEAGHKLLSEHCQIEAKEKTFTVIVHTPMGKDYRLSIGPLGGEIKPSECSVKAKESGSVTITLKKANATNWSNILMKKDEKEKFDTKDTDKENPEAGLMKMMQKLYDDGDDEMKRMMQKAWHESRSGKKPDFPDTMGM